MSKIAILAGKGQLPFAVYDALVAQGQKPLVYAVYQAEEGWDERGADVKVVSNPLKFALILGAMKLRGVTDLVLAGRVPKKEAFDRDHMDDLARQTIDPDVGDDHSLLEKVVATIEAFGLKVRTYDDLLPQALASEGLICGRPPTEQELADGQKGFELLGHLLPLSFGQGLVVHRGSVVAVEAMEGTDAMIRRAGELMGAGVVVKGLKQGQDRRTDLPVVGVETLKTMAQSGLTALFVASGDVLLLDKEAVARAAGELGLCIWGMK